MNSCRTCWPVRGGLPSGSSSAAICRSQAAASDSSWVGGLDRTQDRLQPLVQGLQGWCSAMGEQTLQAVLDIAQVSDHHETRQAKRRAPLMVNR
jgi:hypothetical protein